MGEDAPLPVRDGVTPFMNGEYVMVEVDNNIHVLVPVGATDAERDAIVADAKGFVELCKGLAESN